MNSERSIATETASVEIDADKLRIFVSYARADASDFAEYLVVALELAGFDAYLDRHDIAKAEDWEARLGDLIAGSDTVIFVITPSSIKSPRCDWEVEHTLALGKRLVPVQWIAVDEAEIRIEVKRLNYTVFSSGQPFSGPLAELAEALKQDLVWLRQQTQLDEQAARWHARDRDLDLLLRGNELVDARLWTRSRKTSAPEISSILKAFIGASEESERERQAESQKRLEEREKLLGDAEAAQKQRAEALQQAEVATEQKARNSRRTFWFSIVGMTVLFGLSLFAYKQRNVALRSEQAALQSKADAVQSKEVIYGLIKRIRVGTSNPDGIRAMKKICDEAIKVTSELSQTEDLERYTQSKERFLELYYGDMNLIEIRQKTDAYEDSEEIVNSSIEGSMVRFGKQLDSVESSAMQLPSPSLHDKAMQVKSECSAYMRLMEG